MRFEVSTAELLASIPEGSETITFEVDAVSIEEHQLVCAALAEARKPFWRKIADKLLWRK